jgi:hypothetical protein
MEPGSNQDGVVNMTRAIEALSPWLKHPRRTIIQVERLVIAAAVLLLLQLVFGCCKRQWHNSFLKYGLQLWTKLMDPLIIYTLGTMQPSPIKNSSYPVWAGFLIMASAGTAAVQQYDFCDSYVKKAIQACVEYLRYAFYVLMFLALMDPNTFTLKAVFDLKRHGIKNARASSNCVFALVLVIFFTKFFDSVSLVGLGYQHKWSRFTPIIRNSSRRTQGAETRTEETASDGASDSDPQSMKAYEYTVCHRLCRHITIDQIWDCCGNSADGRALKDLCLSCALFQRLVQKRYFGNVYPKTSLLKDHDFVFKKLLPSEGDFKRAFRIIEVELGFCYDFFFTKYYHTFVRMNLLPVPFIESVFLLKITLILVVGVFIIRNSLVLETPNPIIEVQISDADYIITLLVLGVALLVELVQAWFYLTSNWVQVSLVSMFVKKYWWQPNAFVIENVIGFLRRFRVSRQLRNKINQHSVIFQWNCKQPDPVEVSDGVKRAIARSLISTCGNNLTSNGQTSLRQNQMFAEYSWALKGLSQLEVMLIWHIATEYCDCDTECPTPSNRAARCRCNKHRGFAANFSRYCAPFFGHVLQTTSCGVLPNHKRNRIITHNRGVAVHLSRYCAYLIGYVPELLPYHEADIAELSRKFMEERTELFGFFYRRSKIYGKMKNLEGTGVGDDPRRIFEKGVKLGKQLQKVPNTNLRWEVLKDFWAKTIIHAAASHYTTKQHMQHLENGGEFLTHIWALLAHAGILGLDWNKGQAGQDNLGSGPSVDI